MKDKMQQMTPMMRSYLETKEQYKDCILFYRLGDFYEMFFEDALCVTKELEITLTAKSCGLEERAPMCGVPFHSAEGYINRLVEKGYKVAICEQMEDPKEAKGLVKREVIRIVTPGTNCFTSSLDETKNNYLMGIVAAPDNFGVSVADVTTGEFFLTEVSTPGGLLDEVNRYMPSEIIANDAFFTSGIDAGDVKNRLGITVSSLEPAYFDAELCRKTLCRHFSVLNLDGLGLSDYTVGVTAAGSVMQYLEATQKCPLAHITQLRPCQTGNHMALDRNTRRNLELVETLREKHKRGSLLWVLDKTKTAMGARKLRSCMEQPLTDREEIEKRYDAVEELNRNVITREEIREYLNPVYDLERLLGKISYKTVNPRDMTALASSLSMLPHIRQMCEPFESALLRDVYDNLDPLADIYELIHSAIKEEPSVSLREGDIIRPGYHEEIDRLRTAKTEGKDWIVKLEAKERENTGIKNLRIKYNKVFGYYLEVTKSFISQVPDTWTRKQTLTNAERYTTPELKEMENVILGAEDRLYNLEYAVFCEVREKVFGQMARIQKDAAVIATLDMMASLAYVAEHNRYVRPAINNAGKIEIKAGRHPVIEQISDSGLFVSNDTFLDDDTHRVIIITGPNMAGKSTYMRQTALIVLMAQIGSFVPAEAADLSIVDRIFTRVGASDDLASGQSTFMVEMTEVANILHNATPRSLIVLDEIGRGTSTFDGLSIAWAVVEHIADKKILGAKTLFATHYHELTELEGKLPGVQNYCIAVKEEGEDIVFLRKIIKGGADRSYGIQVARLAGVPEAVLRRARCISDSLEADNTGMQPVCGDGTAGVEAVPVPVEAGMQPVCGDGTADSAAGRESIDPAADAVPRGRAREESGARQPTLFDFMGNPEHEKILEQIRGLDLSQTTPIDALNIVYKWQNMLNE